MIVMGAKEAAEVIRQQVTADRATQAAPEFKRKSQYLEKVVEHLGLEVNPGTVNHVFLALRSHGLDAHDWCEYPKMVYGPDNVPHVAQDKEDEAKILHGKAVEHPDISPAVEDLDLRSKVPEVKLAEHPAGRAPDAETNRAASQGTVRKRPV